MRLNQVRNRLYRLLGLGVAIAISFILVSIVNAQEPDATPNLQSAEVIGLAADPIDCLSIGPDTPNQSLGSVNLTWRGEAQRARLIIRVSGTEAAHSINVNGQTAATVPIFPDGGICSDGTSFMIDIAPDLLVQGENTIEITSDALAGDGWSVEQVRLEVIGNILPADSSLPNVPGIQNAQLGTATTIFPGTLQEFRRWIPDNYNPSTPTPLLVATHPRSNDMFWGEDTFASGAAPVPIDQKDWLMASPQMHGSWTIDAATYEGKYAYASLESQADIIGAVKYMLANFNVDPNRIYIAGYSMGGQIAVVTGAKYPDTFAAVFDNKGITNLIGLHGGAETTKFHRDRIEEECHISNTPQTPAGNPFCYQRRSGVNYGSNLRHVPISIIHHVNDTLVPYTHSTTLATAINQYRTGNFVNVVGITGSCGNPNCHDYEPPPISVLNYLESFTLNNNPTNINIITDKSKPYYWLNIAQSGGDHWTRVEANYNVGSLTINAIVTDSTGPVSVGFNMGGQLTNNVLPQPGMGFPDGTYSIMINNGSSTTTEAKVYNAASSPYFTATMPSAGQFTVTIKPISLGLDIYLPMILAGNPSTVALTATVKDQLDNLVLTEDGKEVSFAASEGIFPAWQYGDNFQWYGDGESGFE